MYNENNMNNQKEDANNTYNQYNYDQYQYGTVESNIIMEEPVKPRTKRKIPGFIKVPVSALAFGMIAAIGFQTVQYASGNTGNQAVVSENSSSIGLSTTKDSSTLQAVNTTASQSSTSDGVSGVVENAMPSIVSIQVKSTVETSDMFGRVYSQEASGSGSGIIIGQNDSEVLIATNNHVVADATAVEITFNDETTATAEVKGTDSGADLAVVSVPLDSLTEDTKSSIKVATLGDSDDVKVGEMAIAIGNALGYGQSITVGYVSAKDREVATEDYSMKLLQTDAAINPGNSGGALLNSKGEVIGINSVKYSSEEVEGMGYAIPITYAIPIINDLMSQEDIPENEQAFLGIKGQDVTEEIAKKLWNVSRCICR
ncbi:MAG TPA: trypsin-like peptidase domain-containing protein [Lachnospiraceae bacterium]|nr:trypsin-like peptidase domain-containing protein [Lachnospiraceae bacterium]